MFTGIVEETGALRALTRGAEQCKLEIAANAVLQDVKIGDSIAVNGVCLTVVKFTGSSFVADVMPETLKRSSLGSLKRGDEVNLERALAANGRFGGHIVSGHIDGAGTIASIAREANAVWFTINAPASILRLVVEKGSIAIDGISLTVAAVFDASFKVSVIPHTLECTNLGSKRAGDMVNLENDLIGKYVEKLLKGEPAIEGNSSQSGGLTREFLARNGF